MVQADKKPDARITAAKLVLGAIVVAVLGAATAITVVLLQDKDSAPTPATIGNSEVDTKVLDEAALEGPDGIKKILISVYGLPADQIGRVECPADQEVKTGNQFSCTVQLGSAVKVVDIKVLDDLGQYQVSLPRDR